MDNVLLVGLLGLGLLFALLCGFGRRLRWFPLSGLCAVGGILLGLAAGYSLDALLLPVLLLAAAGLLPLLRKGGGA